MIAKTDGEYDVQAARADFPALNQRIGDYSLVYLDSAASAQKPRSMIEETKRFLEHDFSNVHRGVHTLSQRATEQFEAVREKVREVLGAAHSSEIVFTKGCTEGINLVTQSLARNLLKPGDEILVTAMEHHSNLVPWQIVAEQTGAKVVAIPLNERGDLAEGAFESLLNERTKFFACVHISNSIGTVNPVADLIAKAKAVGAICLVDGAQAGPHMAIDVQQIAADFYTLSCHKMYAPTGVGVLYGRRELWDSMPPYQGGGGMIEKVDLERTTYAAPPERFEAGTPNIVGIIGLGASIEYISSLSGKSKFGRDSWIAAMAAIEAQESALLEYATPLVAEVPGVRIIGTAKQKAAILSFVVDNVHAHDVGQILDSYGVAVRVGHHCCQPLMKHFGVPATARASFGLYNDLADVDRLVDALHKVSEVFS